jgi:hypothetical protein
MKRSELKKMIENAYVDLSKIHVGDVQKTSGVTTKISDINPETGKLSWDVSYEVDPEELYKKLADLSDFLKDVPKTSEMGKIGDIIKKLKNQSHRLI